MCLVLLRIVVTESGGCKGFDWITGGGFVWPDIAQLSITKVSGCGDVSLESIVAGCAGGETTCA